MVAARVICAHACIIADQFCTEMWRPIFKQTLQIDAEFHAVMLCVSFIQYCPAEGAIKLMLQTDRPFVLMVVPQTVNHNKSSPEL